MNRTSVRYLRYTRAQNVTEPRTALTVSPAPPHESLNGRPHMDDHTLAPRSVVR